MTDLAALPMSRESARIFGLKKYIRLKPCKRQHHPAWHYTVNDSCIACTRLPFAKRCNREVTAYVASRQAAKALGLKRYFTGFKCVRGHIAQRYTSTGACAKCKQEARWQKQPSVNALGEVTLTLHQVHVGDRQLIVEFADSIKQARLLGKPPIV